MVGGVDGVMEGEIDIEALPARRLRLFGVSNKLRSPAERAANVRGFVADLLPLIAGGRITPVIGRVFDFPELPPCSFNTAQLVIDVLFEIPPEAKRWVNAPRCLIGSFVPSTYPAARWPSRKARKVAARTAVLGPGYSHPTHQTFATRGCSLRFCSCA